MVPLGVAVGEVLAEAVEAAFPGGALAVEPVLGGAQPVRLRLAGAYPTGFGGHDQAAGLQYLQVLQDGGQRHVQRAGQVAHRRRPVNESLHHRPPGRVGQRVEDPVQRRTLVRHVLKYRRVARRQSSDRLTIAARPPAGPPRPG